MNGITIAILVALGIIFAVWLYKTFKPYFIKYDTTITINGGLGSGKTLTAVKLAVVLIRRTLLVKYFLWNKVIQPIDKAIKSPINKKRLKWNCLHRKDTNFVEKPLLKIKAKRKKPLLYSNIPIHYKKHIFGKERVWATKLEASHIVCLKKVREFSVVFIDELPQFVNQFNWNSELIQNNVNEFITFFRHYVGGYFITTAQSPEDIVVQIRRKLNQSIWCFNFKKHLFGLFYTIRMCDIMLSDMVGTVTTTFIEENTRLYWGFFPSRNTYSTRCFKPRYDNCYVKEDEKESIEKMNLAKSYKWTTIQTTEILRLMKYKSPLDKVRTEEEKKLQWEEGEKIWKN